LQTHEGSATFSNVNSAARLHRLLVILSMATARPGIRAVELAETLKVSTRTVFRDLAELQRLGFPVAFGNGYPAQQELFRRRRRQEMSQVMADLVDQQLDVVRRKLPPEEAERVVGRRSSTCLWRLLRRSPGPWPRPSAADPPAPEEGRVGAYNCRTVG